MWGFYYNFTNYNFRQTLDFKKRNMFCQRGEIQMCIFEIQGLFEIIVGEIVVKSRYKRMGPRSVFKTSVRTKELDSGAPHFQSESLRSRPGHDSGIRGPRFEIRHCESVRSDCSP